MCWAGFAGFAPRADFSSSFSGPDALLMAGMDQINSNVVFVQTHQNPSRGAEAVSFGSETIEILHLQFIDMVSDVCCAGPAISGADWEKTAAIPQLQLVVALRCCDVPVVCNNSLVVRVQETAMSRSCYSRGVELIVASCHRSLKSCRCSACSIGCRRCTSGGCRCACRALCTSTGPGLTVRAFQLKSIRGSRSFSDSGRDNQ